MQEPFICTPPGVQFRLEKASTRGKSPLPLNAYGAFTDQDASPNTEQLAADPFAQSSSAAPAPGPASRRQELDRRDAAAAASEAQRRGAAAQAQAREQGRGGNGLLQHLHLQFI
tara:strand:- start:3621 stop:3962 length:342 start_codon:yes stop_codon:yes gene_type:complete